MARTTPKQGQRTERPCGEAMKQALDFEQIACGLGARRVGKVRSSGGYFGALQLAAEVKETFRATPEGGQVSDASSKYARRQLEVG